MSDQEKRTEPAATYLGDSTTARYEDGSVVLVRDFSDGSEQRVTMDPLVLSEFLDWLEENELIRDPWKRGEESP